MKPQHVCRYILSDRYSLNGVIRQDKFCPECNAAYPAIPVSPAPRQLPLTPTTRKEK